MIDKRIEGEGRILVDWIEAMVGVDSPAAAALRESLIENPGRITRAFQELLSGYEQTPEQILTVTLELPPGGFSGLVSSIGTQFVSLCAHHFLPFFGSVDIVYEPGSYILGIGKFPRLVSCRSRRFQLQELLVKDICEDVMRVGHAKGVFVRVSAQHTCVCYRGPSSESTTNITTYSLGTLIDPNSSVQVAHVLGSSWSTNGGAR